MTMESPKVSRMWRDLQEATSRLVFWNFLLCTWCKSLLQIWYKFWHLFIYEHYLFMCLVIDITKTAY